MTRHLRGFTLIEVLAALALIGLVLPVVMHGVSLSLRVASDAQQRTEAGLLAQQKLNELALNADAAPTSGDFAPDRPGYRWQAAWSAGPDGVTELTMTVRWDDRGVERDVALTTWVRPGNGGAAR